MDQAFTAGENRQAAFSGWCFNETVEIARQRQALEEQKKEIEDARTSLEREMEEFKRRMEWEEQRLHREQELFEMKLRILEEELQKFATDKAKFEQQKAFYDRVNEFQSRERESSNVVQGEMFFVGVENRDSLKKRYKDLIKIYHPDNAAGDTSTIQEINNEYQKLSMALEA